MPDTTTTNRPMTAPHQAPWHGRLLAALIYGLIRAVAATIRWRWEDRSQLFTGDAPQPVVFCIWHNRLSLCLMLFLNYFQRRQSSRRLAAMVSASRDGGLLTRVLELFKVQPVRGSSSRRGPQALHELTHWADRGYDLAITPDGPRGPRYKVQEGVIALGQLTGHPVVPACYYLNWKIQVNSWDRFQIPLPFARCSVVIGEPLHIPRDAGDAEREILRQTLEQRLCAITRD